MEMVLVRLAQGTPTDGIAREGAPAAPDCAVLDDEDLAAALAFLLYPRYR